MITWQARGRTWSAGTRISWRAWCGSKTIDTLERLWRSGSGGLKWTISRPGRERTGAKTWPTRCTIWWVSSVCSKEWSWRLWRSSRAPPSLPGRSVGRSGSLFFSQGLLPSPPASASASSLRTSTNRNCSCKETSLRVGYASNVAFHVATF